MTDANELAREAGQRVELYIETTPYGYAAIVAGLRKLQRTEPHMYDELEELIDQIERGNTGVGDQASAIAARASEVQDEADIGLTMVPEEEEDE